jgi:hypothetical protein
MLLLNGEKYKLTAEDLKTIKEVTKGKWPVVFTYLPSMMKDNPINPNRKDSPRSIIIPCTTPIIDPKTKERSFLQYYSTSTFRPDGSGKRVEEYAPYSLDFIQTLIVQETQKDLFWFLYNNHHNATGPSAGLGATHYFQMEDLGKQADDFVEEKSLELSVQFAIMSSDGLSDERLREAAAAYYIPKAHEKSISELRQALYNIVMAPDKRTRKPNIKSLQDFNKLTKGGAAITLKAKIQKAIELRIIAHKMDKKKWFWCDDEGKTTTTICPSPNAVKAPEELYEYLSKKGNEAEAKEFVAEVDKVAAERAVTA